MRNLAEYKKNLQDEISALLDRLNSQRSRIQSDDASAFDSILSDLTGLQKKIAALQFLLSLPEEEPEQEPVIIPFIPAVPEKVPFVPVIPELPKKEEPVVPQPKPVERPVVPVAPELPKKEEPVVIPKEKQAEPIQAPEKNITPAGKKLADIRSFIGFNEKIMFLRNLFRNESGAYDEALNQINSCATFTEAETFIGVLKNEYSWDPNKEAVQIFIDTVKRRFA